MRTSRRIVRDLIKLRYRLMPYLYDLALALRTATSSR